MPRFRWSPPPLAATAPPELGPELPTVPAGYAPAELPTDAPPGARQAFASSTTLVILGDPDPEDEGHNCDFQGCGWDHVLEIRQITPEASP
jgi:hypothetical protein